MITISRVEDGDHWGVCEQCKGFYAVVLLSVSEVYSPDPVTQSLCTICCRKLIQAIETVMEQPK